MSTAAMTSMLIDRLREEHPGRVLLVSEASLDKIRKDPGWGRVGAYPIGSPEFIRPCKRHLQAGRRLVIVDITGRGIHVYANKSKAEAEAEAREAAAAPAPQEPLVTVRVTDEGGAAVIHRAPAPEARPGARPLLRASSLEARPPTGVAPYTAHLGALPTVELLDAPPAPDRVAMAELAMHEAELQAMPLHSAWPVLGYALREARVDGARWRASWYLFSTASARRRRQAVGQLHVEARLGDSGLRDAWVEVSGLVFDREPPPAPTGPVEVVALGEADDDEDDAGEAPEEHAGGFRLQVLFAAAEAQVDAEEAAAAPPPPPRRRAPKPAEAPLASPPPPGPSRVPPPRVLLGFALFLSLVAWKLSMDRDDEREADTWEATLEPLPDPYEASPLPPLPLGVRLRLTREGKPTVMGPLRPKVVGRALKRLEPRFTWCVHEELLRAPDTDTSKPLSLRVVLSETGALARLELGHDGAGSGALRDCLEAAFDDVVLPTPKLAGATAASYTYRVGLVLPDAEPR